MSIAQTIAKNIRAARETDGLSQSDLAKAIGMTSHSAVSDMENARRKVSATELEQLSKALGRSIDWFFNPNASAEDFVVLARAQEKGVAEKEALRKAQNFLENYVLLRQLLG